MEARTTRTFTVARIVAFAVMTLLVVGLLYLRFAPGGESVSVPPGARAGDLILRPCTYPTENGSYAAECGTLVVPENRAKIGSRLIALPVTRVRARSDHSSEPIFYLEGGPGITNMDFKQASRFAAHRDVVLVGYRGVDGSVRLDCPEVRWALAHSADVLSEETNRAFAAGLRACAARLTEEGVDLAGYGLPQQVDDLEAARVALGYDRIDLLSQSAGTRTAMIYAWRYPERINRSVMIGVNPPGHFVWDTQTSDEQIGRYAARCSKDSSCSERTADLAVSIRRTNAAMPSGWFFLPIKPGNVRVASFYGLMESASTGAQPSAPMTLDSWLSAAEGDASGLWLLSLIVDVMLPDAFVSGEYAAAGSLDAQTARDYFSSGTQQRDSLAYAGTAFAWGGGRMADAWPTAADENAYSQVLTSQVETLLIGGELDTSTPPQVTARELLPYLPNGHQVVVDGVGHTASFFAVQPEAGSRLINTFFDSGQVDDSLYRPEQVGFTPGITLTALAKILLGVMLGLALLTVLSMLWIARRVQKRGGFGHNASAALRSASPAVLGLGGWCLGALVVLTIFRTVPLDDQLLAVISIGLPIGLGIYLAWVNRDWTAETKITGGAAVAGGALVGSWLGFHAGDGFLAVVTTIIGAGVGANLALLTLDIGWGRSTRSRFSAGGLSPDSVATPVQLERRRET
jgi:pimeloyl-ACP methyl ester carboxylesterase